MLICTGLYLLGFAAGSLVSGPLSEILGRNLVYTGSLTLFMIFVLGSALAPNIGAQLAFRFLAGIFGCPPLTCAGGTIADLWNPLEKTIYFPLYAILSFGGPVLGPVLASYMGQTGVLSWRWTSWIILIMSGAILVLIIIFQPETYSPLLLKWKGKQLRQMTGDPRFRSEMDMEKISLWNRIGGAMKRQFLITIHEPIILLISLYMTVLYIVLFTFFDGYTYIFSDVHGLSQGMTNIVWVAMYVGILFSTILVPFIYRATKKEFTAAAQAAKGADPAVDPHALDGVHTQPEIRLWFAMFGAPFIPISLFWMGWTDFVSTSLDVPLAFSNVCSAIGISLVPHHRIILLRSRHDLRLHQFVHVRHRLVRYLRSIRFGLHDRLALLRCGWDDGCWNPILPEHGCTLDAHDLGLHQRDYGPGAVCVLQVRSCHSPVESLCCRRRGQGVNCWETRC